MDTTFINLHEKGQGDQEEEPDNDTDNAQDEHKAKEDTYSKMAFKVDVAMLLLYCD
ncbi:hypothetical protein FQN53_000875 [Emmonsiellopsis sp. PD_33]|nr:hypothetical protein FQN53_000875 [Emmonsiellopsis sp. PD_33]